MSFIANLGKKASVIYLIVTTILFLLSLTSLIAGLIFLYPEASVEEVYNGKLYIILGSVGLFLVVLFLSLASLASNYMKSKNEKN